MPEGHSIHRVAKALTLAFAEPKEPHGKVAPVHASSPQGRFAAGATLMDGQRLAPAHAWGKHLFVPFEEDQRYLHVHLGLYGSWTFQADPRQAAKLPPVIGAPRVTVGEDQRTTGTAGDPASSSPKADPNAHEESWQWPEPKGQVRLRLANDYLLADLSGPTKCQILDPEGRQAIINRLGPDPLRNEPGDEDRFVKLVRAKKSPIGQLVMDQSVVAGPGNIYRAECLFRTGINPWRPGQKVSEKRLRQLWKDLVAGLADGFDMGLIYTRLPELELLEQAEPTRLVGQEVPEREERFYVYQRDGQACLKCGTTVKMEVMQARKLFYCPGCQR
ncbi:hypothetical protein BSR29_02515 [Boudabousia liubingyangii]|uniref:DNA-(apurinic or apyrimidinic site) lyase n=1 Tax=Boudabousia liubingyangii TaxID=1921764 RepID=A0A1Q5PQI0_9ACTO|nr:DNA-formamidopyrimidine glycosylase family protein [Boudabousia liubingyangii]OKL49834.1 hypothetical protein BSR29_02515 [Boudabousia liubingyangii]